MQRSLVGLFAAMVLVIVARLLPHPVNISPFGACLLLVGLHVSRKLMAIWVVATLLISDCCLGFIHGWAWFGWWSFFNSIAYLSIGVFLAPLLVYRWRMLVCIAGSLYFWLVSNLGVWLTSNFYGENWQGLFECYAAALPFLTSSCLGDLAWFYLLSGLLIKANSRWIDCELPRLRSLQS